MEYAIGLLLGLGVAGLASMVGLDRQRAFYPTVLIVVAFYYVLFAAMGGSRRTLAEEIAQASVFSVLAILGFKKNLWIVAAGLIAHGCFDFVHQRFIADPGVPPWWPGFCLTADAALGAWLAVRLARRGEAAIT